jgi:hypothetical protein
LVRDVVDVHALAADYVAKLGEAVVPWAKEALAKSEEDLLDLFRSALSSF